MYAIIHDRIFWIYFVVTLLFIVIGMCSIISSNDPNRIFISMGWLFANILLMILVYHASIEWGPNDPRAKYAQICFFDKNSNCWAPANRTWLFINLIYVVLLIMAILWAGELNNTDGSPLRTMSGVITLLGGIILCNLIQCKGTGSTYYNNYIIPFWIGVVYLVIWFALTLYVATSSS
jgi:hypothetical protein